MQERDLLLRWLRAFFEGLNKLLNKSSVDKKEIQEIYSSFFGKNRANFLKPEAIIMIEELFSENDDITKKEKLAALCQLMELDLIYKPLRDCNFTIEILQNCSESATPQ